MKCKICGRFIKPNAYGACEYPRYCYEKAAMKECEPASKAAETLYMPGKYESDLEDD